MKIGGEFCSSLILQESGTFLIWERAARPEGVTTLGDIKTQSVNIMTRGQK